MLEHKHDDELQKVNNPPDFIDIDTSNGNRESFSYSTN